MRDIILVSFVSSFCLACGGEVSCPAGYLEDAAGNCLQADGAGSDKGGGNANGGSGGGAGAGGGEGGGNNAGGTSAGGNSDGTTDVWLINATDGWEVTELYISPCDSDSWGSDQLSGSLFDGEEYVVYGVPNGCYDMQAWSWNGAVVWDNFGANLSGGSYDFTLW